MLKLKLMNTKIIATLYFYLVSAGSLILIVVGIFSMVNFLVNVTQYEKYPLRYGAENCEDAPLDYHGAMGPVVAKPMERVETNVAASPSAQERQKMIEICKKNAEYERKQHKIEDVKNAIAFPIVGGILFAIHFPLARRMSKEK